MNLYNLKLVAPNKYQMAKFSSEDFNVEAVYDLEQKGFSYTCNCPANSRSVVTKPCKHKRMMPLMLDAVNTDRFYNPDTHMWCEPLGDLLRPEADLEGREALPNAVAGKAVPQAEIELASTQMLEAELSGVAVEAEQAPATRSAAPSIRRR